jgi:hypothetical protein
MARLKTVWLTPRWALAACFACLLSNANAQPADFPARVEGGIAAFLAQPGYLNDVEAAKRARAVEFLLGSLVFTLGHEFGHAAISEFGLPVLGREEDAADGFAALLLLRIGNSFTQQATIDAATGLVAIGRFKEQANEPINFYSEHGFDMQRAAYIACLMYGSNPTVFASLAERAQIPAERRETCPRDFQQTEAAWKYMLENSLRRNARPSARGRNIRPERHSPIVYSPPPADLVPARDFLVRTKLLESVRDFVVRNFAFREGLTIEAKSCGRADAAWFGDDRRMVLCYELVTIMLAVAITATR